MPYSTPTRTPRSTARPLLVAAAAALLLAAPCAGLAQAAPAGMEALPADPTLRQLIDESLTARPEVKQAEATVSAERDRVPQVGALPDPVLSLGIQNDGFKGIQVGKMETSFYQVMLSQALPWPGKRGLREDVARLSATQAESSVSRLRLSTEADVRRAYLDLLVVRERLALLADLERLWLRSIGTARARYEAGDGAQSDVLRAQLELNRLQQRRWAMKAEEASRVQALNRLRGRPLDEPIASGASVRDLPLPPVPELDPAVADAEGRSPELSAVRTAGSQADAQVRLALRERYPDLSVQVGIMPRGGLEPMWTAGVSIGLPVWSGRKQGRAVAESEARSGAAAQGREAVAQVVRLRVAERRSALASLLETLRLYRQGLLVQSQATTESTLAQYRVGKVTFASVLEANAGYLADQEAHLLASADAQRIAIASAEVSLGPIGPAGSAGGLGSTSVPGAGAAGGGGMPGGGSSSASSAPPAASGGSSSSGM
jgi:outer membrane protein, heavy metal efflux system